MNKPLNPFHSFIKKAHEIVQTEIESIAEPVWPAFELKKGDSVCSIVEHPEDETAWSFADGQEEIINPLYGRPKFHPDAKRPKQLRQKRLQFRSIWDDFRANAVEARHVSGRTLGCFDDEFRTVLEEIESALEELLTWESVIFKSCSYDEFCRNVRQENCYPSEELVTQLIVKFQTAIEPLYRMADRYQRYLEPDCKQQEDETSPKGKERAGRGRKPPPEESMRIDKAIWETQRTKRDYEATAKVHGITMKEAKLAYDRHRKR